MSQQAATNATGNWGDLFGLVVERVTAPVEGMHRAITARSLRWTGASGEPTRRRFDGTIAAVYETIRFGGSAVGAAIEIVGSGRDDQLVETRLGRQVQAVINATWGDELEERSNGLRIEMGLRDAEGRSTEIADLKVTPRVVVLVHGLGRTERCWQAGSDGVGLWDRLTADPSLTPVMIRYNTGRHISDNGADLADLLEDLWRGWPTPFESISLVGHSMGGLVIRSACQVGKAAQHAWVGALDKVVTVGTPHLGAPLEKAANVVSWSLRVAPESRPLADFLDARSVGIKDLRFGAIVEEDWRGTEPDALLRNTVGDVRPLEGVDHHFVAAVVTDNPRHPVGALIGDLMVRAASGIGQGRNRSIEASDVHVHGGRRHFDLLHDARIQDQVLECLTVTEGKTPE